MGLRGERKLVTRRALLDAALTLMAEGHPFGALSLREVARVAQVVPTAFYRHFRDMDELGLALVDETFFTLRRLLRDVRLAAHGAEEAARVSMRAYLNQLRAHRQVFEFVSRERYGGTPAVRAALSREMRVITVELADDLGAIPTLAHLEHAQREVIAQLIVSAMASLTGDVLDVAAGPTAESAEAALAERAVTQLVLIARGAAAWKRRP